MSAIRRVMMVILCSFPLLGCQEDGLGVSESETSASSLFDTERVECERRGGNWAPTPNKTSYTCFRQSRDANKSCQTSDACEGLCLARSRTCAPIIPLYGCHEILTSQGVRQTLCVE